MREELDGKNERESGSRRRDWFLRAAGMSIDHYAQV